MQKYDGHGLTLAVCVLQESDCCVSLAIFMVCLWVCGYGLLGVKEPSI